MTSPSSDSETLGVSARTGNFMGGGRRWDHGIAAVLFIIVAIPMIAGFVDRGSFWGDEAALAINIESRSYLAMGRPFVLLQVCPWLTMAAIKLATQVIGTTEHGYRIVPLLAALSATGLAYLVGRRVAGYWGGLSALVICGSSSSMATYATELKPYSVDAAVAMVLILATLRVLEDPESKRRRIILGGLGVIAGWASLPSLFVMAGCGLALVLEAYKSRRNVKYYFMLLALGAVWILSFYIHFSTFVARSEIATTTGPAEYWRDSFAPFPPTSLDELRWYFGKYFYAFKDPLCVSQRYFGGVLFAVGALFLVRRGRSAALLAIAGAWGFATIAAMLGRYPPVGRLLLFLAPSLAVVVGASIAAMASAGKRWGKVAAAGCLLLLVVPGLSGVWSVVSPTPDGRGDLKTLITDLSGKFEVGDTVYIAEGGNILVWKYYAPGMGLPDEVFRINDIRAFKTKGVYNSIDKLGEIFGRERVWLITPSVDAKWDPAKVREDSEAQSSFVTRYLEKCGGRRLSQTAFEEHDLFLYDLGSARLPEGIERNRNPRP